jgi:hypothetical protein
MAGLSQLKGTSRLCRQPSTRSRAHPEVSRENFTTSPSDGAQRFPPLCFCR